MKPIRVLILDDDPTVRDSLRGFLEDLGFSVQAVGEIPDAVRAVEADAIDVAVVDLRLPGANGETFILSAHARRPGMRFLIYTGSTGYDLPDALCRIGVTGSDVLHKPAPSLHLIADAVVRLARAPEDDHER